MIWRRKQKMRLVNVIGGLEKHTIPKMSMFIDGVEIGHNQLCNRQVEVDGGEIAKVIDSIFGGCHTDNEWEDRKAMTEAISKAISQGKVLKLKKEE